MESRVTFSMTLRASTKSATEERIAVFAAMTEGGFVGGAIELTGTVLRNGLTGRLRLLQSSIGIGL